MVVYGYFHITLHHYHHYANLIEGTELIKCLSDVYYVSSMCLRWDQFSQLSLMQYIGMSVFSSPIYLMMIAGRYVLAVIIIINSQVWPIFHCLGLGHETMVCAVCLDVFLWIGDMAGLLRGTLVSWKFLPRIWAPSQYKDRLIYVWRFPCSRQDGRYDVLSLTWESPFLVRPSFLLRRPPGPLSLTCSIITLLCTLLMIETYRVFL